jgi:aminoglycoside 6-adenylyltransferase
MDPACNPAESEGARSETLELVEGRPFARQQETQFADQEEDEVIRRLIGWGEGQASVRAMLLTSSRARPGAPVDRLSDYDVILVMTDIHPVFEDRAWLGDFGPVLVVYRDPIEPYYGHEKSCYVTQYEDGLKIDLTLWPVEILRAVAADPILPPGLDDGYRVLLDKDGLAAGLQAPTHRAYIPTPPGEEAFHLEIELFFHEATYVAKHLWRDDLMAAKYNLDYAMKGVNLRQMLEWRMEIDHAWSVKPGAYGRGLKRRLAPDLWQELEATYAGAGLEENWEALFRTIDLFRKAATQVAGALGYRYPHDLDRRAVAYLEKVRNL